MGAATVLSCCNAKQLPSQVKGIISDCAFSSGWEQVAHVMKSRLHLPAFPLLSVYNKVCQAMGGYNLKDISPVDCVKDSKVPILFIHGDEDHFVPTSMVYRLYHACKGHKQLLIVREQPMPCLIWWIQKPISRPLKILLNGAAVLPVNRCLKFLSLIPAGIIFIARKYVLRYNNKGRSVPGGVRYLRYAYSRCLSSLKDYS